MDTVTPLNTEDKDYNLGQDVNKKVSGNDRRIYIYINAGYLNKG